MKDAVITPLLGAALLAAALSGCSGTGHVNAAGESVSTTGQSVSTTGHAKVIVDGKDQNVSGNVTCQKAGGELQIGIGQPGSPTAIAVQATDTNPPTVHQIALGTVDNVALAYQQGSPGASADATQNVDAYKFSGTATGVDKTNFTGGLVSKPFEVDVTCP
jgi:ipoprotein LpqH